MAYRIIKEIKNGVEYRNTKLFVITEDMVTVTTDATK